MPIVREVMTRRVLTVGVGESTGEARELMLAEGLGAIPVVHDDLLLGMVRVDSLPEGEGPVAPWIEPIPRLRAEEEIGVAARRLGSRPGTFPVIDEDGQLVGVVRAEELYATLYEERADLTP